ncbi:hypothetical protein DCMF_00555 [Candidatus Formimonas warabiya]|uniref:Phosphoglycerate dehydrogenase n=2 Tax=Formimonas warabiya TaxID=1761012 RepID=A0A3G1L0W3_FORW1|nr:hypothetical protein DCMF_00555 [Candidatus Formimonas warabiya]
MKKIIVVSDLRDVGLEILKLENQVNYCPEITREDLLAQICDYDALIGRSVCPIDKEIIKKGVKLKAIGVPAVGVNHIDVDYAQSQNIKIFNVPGVNSDSVAEFTIGHMVNLCRHIGKATFDTKKKIWDKNFYFGREIANKNLGIIGLGRIGSRVARIANAMKMNVYATDPYIDLDKFKEVNAEKLTLEELLAVSDIITMHVPLTQETNNMISKLQINLMRQGAYLLNLCRGEVLDEEAVADALDSGHLAAVAADVIIGEPRPGGKLIASRLLQTENFMVTPHIGAWTMEAQDRAASMVAEAIIEALK